MGTAQTPERVTLTDDERNDLFAAVDREDCFADRVEPVVERILAAREAAVRAQTLRDAAADWDDPALTDELMALARSDYRAGGPSMPTIWLRHRAARIGDAQ